MVYLKKIRRKLVEITILIPAWLRVCWRYGFLRLRWYGSDTSVFTSVFIEKELDVSSFIPNFSPTCIVDAGAYTGLSTRYFTHRYPQAKIHAIEVEANNFDLLTKNTSQFQNIILHNKALWHSNTALSLIDPGKSHWSFQVSETADTAPNQVDTITVSDILNFDTCPTIDLLKIDIEGAEKELFSHSTDWLARVYVIFIELHDRFLPGCREALEQACPRTTWDYHEQGEKVVLINRNFTPSDSV